MKNIINSLFLLFFGLSLGAAQVHIASMEWLQALIQQNNFSIPSLKRHEGYDALVPGSFAVAKSSASAPNYPDGIYRLVITPLNKSPYQRPVYQLDTLELLKNKRAFLHLKINGQPGHAQFRLPAMDTLVESTDIDGCQFLLGSTIGAELPHAYYFMSGKQPFKKPVYFETRRRDRVFATNPQSFSGRDHGMPIKPILLAYQDPLKQFFFDHTRGLSKIPQSKAGLTSAHIVDTDTHNRPARKHQIRQLLEYIIAKTNGVNYMTFAAATGSGKTNTMLRHAELIRSKKILVVTPRENLISQIMDESRAHYPNLTIGGSNESNSTVLAFLQANIANNDITVTSLQGFQQTSVYKNDELLSKIDTVVFDEAHNLFSIKRNEVIAHLKSYKEKKIELLFFTATPTLLIPHSESNMSSVYQLSDEYGLEYHITPFSIFDAIDAKANAPFQIIHVVDLPPLREALKLVDGEYNEAHLNNLLADSDDHHSVVFDLYLKHFGEFAMDFSVGIAHAEKLAAYFNRRLKYPTRNDHAHIWETLKAEYEKNVRAHFSKTESSSKDKRSAEEKTTDFLKKYPFVLADAVHSGNTVFPLSRQDANDKLLRNRLGGSLFLAGATMLMEGFDNPRIKLVFIQRPSRKSNIRQVQTIGRALRIDSKNPDSVAKVFEFVYDDKQLLTSSNKVLGVMSYGIAPGHEIRISMDDHAPDTAPYKLSYDKLSEITLKDLKKRQLSNKQDDEPLAKRSKKSTAHESLKSQLQKLVKDLNSKIDILAHFGDGVSAPDDKDMDVDTAPNSDASVKKTNIRADEFSSSAQSEFIDSDDKDVVMSLLQEAQSLFEIAQTFLTDGNQDQEWIDLVSRITDFENQLGQPKTALISPFPPLLASNNTAVTTHINPQPIHTNLIEQRAPHSTLPTNTAAMQVNQIQTLNQFEYKQVDILKNKVLGTYSRPTHLTPVKVDEKFDKPLKDYLKIHQANSSSPAILELDIYEMHKAFYKYNTYYSYDPAHEKKTFTRHLTKYFLSHCQVDAIEISVIATGDFSEYSSTADGRPHSSPFQDDLEERFNVYVAQVQLMLNELGFKEKIPQPGMLQQPTIAANMPIPFQGMVFGGNQAADPLIIAQQAQLAILTGDKKTGFELYRTAFFLNPYLPEGTYIQAGQAYGFNGDYQAEANLYDRFFQIYSSGSIEISKRAIKVNKELNRLSRAAEIVEICLQKHPNWLEELYKDATQIYYKLNNWHRTAQLIELLMQKNGRTTPDDIYFAIHVYVLLGNWTQAIKYGDAELAKEHIRGSFDLGIAYLQVGRLEEGIAMIKSFMFSDSLYRENIPFILKGRPMEVLREAFSRESDRRYSFWLNAQNR